MTRARTIRLVAGREIASRARSRAFRVSTAVVAAALVVVALVSGGSSGTTTYDLGAVGARPAALAAAVAAAPGFGARARAHRLAAGATARAEVKDGTLDAAVLSGGRIVVKDDPSSTAVQILQAGLARARVAAALRAAGAPASALTGRPAAVLTVGARAHASGDKAVAYLGALILYVSLLISGYAVSSGVVEEKQSRIVEILVAVTRPSDLLAGKILGLGAVSVGQLVIVAAAGVGAGRAKGSLELPSGTTAAIALVIVCFVLGYLLYASLYAAGASLVSRQEEQQAAVMPFTVLLIASYILGNSALSHPSGTLATILSIVPFSSPLVLPGRVAQHAASTGEVVLSLALLALAVPLAVGLAGRLYRGNVLAMGGRVKLATALRNARD